MPYGSFLTRPVSDGDDLAQLLRQDKVVARRFANHYGMTNDAIADYIEKYAKVVTLTQSKNYVEYFIEPSGMVRKHHKLLRPGTRVLAVRNMPILDMRCGNPMNKALPLIIEKVEPLVQETPPPPAPEAAAPAVSPTPELEPVVQPEALLEPTPPPPAPIPVVQVLAEKPMEYPAAILSAPNPTKLAWLLPGLIGVGTLGGGASDSSSPPSPTNPSSPTNPPIQPSQPVPEPAGLLAFGFGGVGFVLTCYRRFRNR